MIIVCGSVTLEPETVSPSNWSSEIKLIWLSVVKSNCFGLKDFIIVSAGTFLTSR